jgi:hypothetical protein
MSKQGALTSDHSTRGEAEGLALGVPVRCTRGVPDVHVRLHAVDWSV